MDSNNDKKMEDELRETVIKACKHMKQILKQEPSVVLERDEAGDLPDSVIEEIEAWLFNRRQNNGDKNN